MKKNLKLTALIALVAIVALAGCKPAIDPGKTGGLTIKFGTASALSKNLASKAITGSGGLGTLDTFDFPVDVTTAVSSPVFYLGSGTNVPLYFTAYNPDLTAGVGNVVDGTGNPYYMVSIGGSSASAIALEPTTGSWPTGSFDNAVLRIGYPLAGHVGTTTGASVLLGPHFNIYDTEPPSPPSYPQPTIPPTATSGTFGSKYSVPGTGPADLATSSGAGTLSFNGDESYPLDRGPIAGQSPTYIFFIRADIATKSTGIVQMTGDDPTNTEADFFDAVRLATGDAAPTVGGADSVSTYWDSFWQEYHLSNVIGQGVSFEIIPIPAADLTFSGSTTTINVTYTPATGPYTITDGNLDVHGAPPINFAIH